VQEALFSLVGPAARAVAGVPDLPEEEHAHVAVELGGAAARAVATDAGVDVLCAAEDAERVRAALLEAGAEPVAEADAEVSASPRAARATASTSTTASSRRRPASTPAP
jgi:hypothetical protein